MKTYQVPNGEPYRNWQAVFDDAQPLPWTAFNTGDISGALQNNAQPERKSGSMDSVTQVHG